MRVAVVIATIPLIVGHVSASAWVRIRDVGDAAGLRTSTSSSGIQVRDYDDDGWPDVLLLHHAGRAQVLHNDAGRGFTVAANLVDTIHDRRDRHDCAWGDVNQDGNDDIYCTKGARKGTAEKWNELWIQGPPGVFTDQAQAFGVEDRWGRGRVAAFLDLNGDPYPDLFVGNNFPRTDGHRSPNRTFANVGGTHFEEVKLGITREVGAYCVQVVDVNDDGWDDLAVCGRHHLFLYVRDDGRFEQRASSLGVDPRPATDVAIASLGGDRRLDIVVVRSDRVQIQRGRWDGTFGPIAGSWALRNGAGVAVGDVDGILGPDVFVVEHCVDGVNVGDLLLRNRGFRRGWDRQRLTLAVTGCGAGVAALDFDRDGLDDFIVQNGYPIPNKGPDQLLTAGRWPD